MGDFVIGAEEAGLHVFDFGCIAAAGYHVADHEVAEHFLEEVSEIFARGYVAEVGLVLLLGFLEVCLLYTSRCV